MRSVVVTGASGGIGREVALGLARRGLDVIGTVRTEEKAAALAAAARDGGTTVRTVLMDVADAKSCEEGFARIEELTGGGPWAVVNNAGTHLAGAVEDVTDEEARRVLDVNLFGPARICRLAVPGMRRRGEGRIVNVTSMAGLVASPFQGWYAASKHALEALSDALRMEVAGDGVKVTLVEPGFHESPMVADGAQRMIRLAAEGASPYQNAYLVALGGLARHRPFRPAGQAARVVCRAVCARRPAARYCTGRESLMVRVHQYAPPALTDGIQRRMTGLLRTVPRVDLDG
ncbi:SDR family oxidoreductase [Streptomyces sp. I05A-00742]|uniref:SDR family oxidoreductase n=1 Tax=Streptomyces sp. I05A-00742 TaxID=2732853 RepID=UPI0014879FED|nr:SDR family oxidoreductase [Streptomyces sp. I05A-00742]